ncbi:hypothetical protein BZG35_00055 [Brevundimonas sp. LM2]|uniref:DUF1697 domain-containing protein n=1 Tax=Brevundimonas sp. LM2 TaxID=1938605 RepID=UPI000983A2A4|nr:DUF1697 domain-containing protein [Brevundimonas sp. LM2]AQR60226.1 hypothetical protein BZG35_00055 [Brevundimonas sp. LM2]
MDHRIILFRAMNTGGVRAAVGEQRAMAEAMGLDNPRTLLASGNLVVESDRDPAELEAAIEAETEVRFGRRIETLVRTPAQWASMMAANPFPDAALTDPAKLLVMVMKGEIEPGAVAALRAFATGDEAVEAVGGDLFLWHPHGIGSSKMAEKAQPRLIGIGTGRNWNTVAKLAAMVGL